MIKQINVKIKGQSALLMHAFPLEPVEALDKKPKDVQAEYAAYRDPEKKTLYIPGVNIQRAFISSATYSKGKGRTSLQKQAAACLMVGPERVDLGIKDYVIDSRPVVVPATKGRVVRHRPRLDKWEASFTLEYDDVLLTESQVRRIVDDAGSRVGLLDFRPEKKGPFGKFAVVSWEAADE